MFIIVIVVVNWIVVLICVYMEYSMWWGISVYCCMVGYESVVWC